jgi:predicted metalloprotease with PDZ domain
MVLPVHNNLSIDMTKYLFSVLFFAFPITSFSQGYVYKTNLSACKKDKIQIELDCPVSTDDTVNFNFPMTIPGTYDILNYGTYISKFKAYDKNQKALTVVKSGVNTYTIYPAKELKTIVYTVQDSWDSKEKEFKIFEPAGTGFEKDEYFYINNGGLFGFFDNSLMVPFTLKFEKPVNMIGYSSMNCLSLETDSQIFHSEDYHALIDNPILFTTQKSASLTVANTEIVVAAYYKENDSSAYYIQKELDSSMQAVEKFIGGALPVSNYNFLNYVADFRDVGKILMSGKIKLYQYPKIMRRMKGQGFGALEHGSSSSYYLPDFGKNSYCSMVSGTAIHEFMHIYSPLSLHSVLIGNFDYVNPKMSEHLWLYEGVTEYFATIIAMQGNLETVESTLQHDLKDKIIHGYSYPDSIPFTEMSAGVFNDPYKDHYFQVYERGAIMAMLLDFEIMRLTEGKKTLKSIIFELTEIYGKDNSFEEDEIIPVLVKRVHPDLKVFFDNYVTGTTPLAIEEGFKLIGVNYQKEKSGLLPIDILAPENGVTANTGIVINNRITIKRADKGNLAGFMPGDQVDRDQAVSCFKASTGEYLKEGEMAHLTVSRKGKDVELSFPVKFEQGIIKNAMEIAQDKTAEQEMYFRLWTEGK